MVGNILKWRKVINSSVSKKDEVRFCVIPNPNANSTLIFASKK